MSPRSFRTDSPAPGELSAAVAPGSSLADVGRKLTAFLSDRLGLPTAILSRQTAGIRGRSLIVNLPGRPKAIRENLAAVFPAIPYCIDLIEGPRLETNEATMKAFRPKA